MTTNASKHGLRAGAAERTKKHAQKTPLPPRKGVIEDAKEVIAAAAQMAGDATDDRSKEKAKAFAEKAATAGWSVSKAIVGGAAELTVTRGSEIIVQAWRNGVWDDRVSFYAFGDRNIRPRNAAGAAKLLLRSEKDAASEASKVSSNRHFRKAEPRDLEATLEQARASLPFDAELAPDDEITGILAGQALVWYNRLSRGQESAIVGRSGVRISFNPDGARVITFCCPATGYRSCLVTAILKVGRGRSTATKGSETESVEVS